MYPEHNRVKIAVFNLAFLLTASAVSGWGQALPLSPVQEAGLAAVPVFEGWFPNPDGSFSLLVGYFNRNLKEELDVPIGPNNNIEPGGPDQGQPTHFLPGRQYGMFVVKVPKDFGSKKVVWTVISHGYTAAIPLYLNRDYEISPFIEAAVGNTPPSLSFAEGGPAVQGPVGLGIQREVKVGEPLSITAWVADDGRRTSSSGALSKNPGPPITLRWDKYRGPGEVKFDSSKPKVELRQESEEKAKFSGKGTTLATFSQPGDYTLHLTVNDYSGDGGAGFQCCWTFGLVHVTVKP